jgi:hypothetical protein
MCSQTGVNEKPQATSRWRVPPVSPRGNATVSTFGPHTSHAPEVAPSEVSRSPSGMEARAPVARQSRCWRLQVYGSLMPFFTYGRSQGSCLPKEQGDY